MADDKKKQNLEQFIVDNQDLEMLESRLEEFNPFEVLKITSHEIRHSNILAWLLDPKGNHNIGTKILRKIILEILSKSENKNTISILEANSFLLSDIIIRREWKNIDILIESKTDNFVIVIENKLFAKESKHQLAKYEEQIKKSFPETRKLFVFLTIDGEPSSNQRYINLSHEDIYRIIDNLLKLNKNNLNQNVVEFINYYLRTLEVLLMTNEEIVELCKNIYKEHRTAIDLINEYAQGSFANIADEFKKKNEEVDVLSVRTSAFMFLPKKIKEKLPTDITSNWVVELPIVFWYRKLENKNKIKLMFEIGPFKNPQKRVDFLRFLKQKFEYKIKNSSLELSSKYTRIFSKNVDFTDWDDEESMLEEVQKLYESDQTKKQIQKMINVLDNYNWKTEETK